jgi:glycosyltransferase involved in cell wall biosynthesis
MRLALDTTPLLGTRTGVGQAVAGLVDALAARPEADRPDLVPFVVSGRAAVRRAGGSLPGRLVPLPAAVLHRSWARVGRPRLDRWLGRPDVVHGTNFVTPPTRAAAEVTTVHDLWDLPARTVALIAASVRRGGWIHTPSAHVAALAAERFRTDRVRAVPWGVPRLPEGGRVPRGVPAAGYALFLGRAIPRKNVPLAVAAAVRLPDVPLVLAGPGTEAWPGGVGAGSDAPRAALPRGAAVLVHPAADEGFGLTVLEAMSVGVPVVAGAAGAVPEVAAGAAVLVPPGDVAALADGVRAALADEGLAARGRARAAAFSWDATAGGLLAVYREAGGS